MSGEWAARAAALCASAAVVERRGPAEAAWPAAIAEPGDIAALYEVSDGLVLADGTTILPRGELARVTEWLAQERSLDWPSDWLVLGERGDLAVVLDADGAGVRAGGGILEAASDGLSLASRVAGSLLGYLERRAGVGPGEPSAEVLLAEAAAARDGEALRAALGMALYPGSERVEAHAALVLGALRAAAGDEAGAEAAFERSVAARVRGARRGAEGLERAAGWRACAAAAREVGAAALAERCGGRGAG